MNMHPNDKFEASEAKFRHLLLQAPVAMSVILGPLFHVSIANKKQLEIWQKEEAEVLHKPLFEIFPELKSHEFHRLLTEVYQTGIPFTGKEIAAQLLRNGTLETAYFDFIYEPLRNEMDEVEGITVVSMDVTEKVLARKQIETNEIFNRTILESSPDCLKVLDREGAIQFMNFNGLCQMGIDDFSTFKNKSWWTVWGTENEALVKASVDKALTGETVHFTAFCPTAKGTPKWWDVMLSPVGKTGEAVQQIISVSRDITEQRLTEEKIRESGERFRSLAESSPDMIVRMDKNLRHTYSSPHIEKFTDKKAAEIIGKTPREIGLPEEFCVFIDEQIALVIEKKQLHAVEYIGLKGENILTRVVPELDEWGNVNSFLIVTTDITERKKSEDAFLKLATHLKLSTDSAKVGTWSLDIKTEKLEWSALHKKMWGYDEQQEDLVYEDWHRIIVDEDKKKAFKKVEEAKINKLLYEVDYRIERANDKVIRWMKAVGQYYYNEAGAAVTLTGISLDITEQKEAETALRKSKERLQVGLDVANLILAEFDYNTGLVKLSAEAALMYGLPPDNLTVTRELIHHTFHPACKENLELLIEQCLNPDGDGFMAIEHRILLPDGQTRWLKVNKQVYFDRSVSPAKPLYSILAAQDITIKKEAEEKIRESEERFRSLTHNSPDTISRLDKDGRYLYASPSIKKFTGKTAEEFIGRRYRELGVPENICQLFDKHIALVLQEKKLYNIEFTAISGLEVHSRLVPELNEKSEAVSVMMIHTDITERKQAEEKLKASEEKYRGIFETMDQGFCIIEMIFDSDNKPVDYLFIEANPVFEKQTGLVNAIGKTAREMVPNLEEHWFQIYGKVALTGEATRFNEGSEAMGRWFEVYTFRLGDEGSKKVAILFTDISNRKKAEQELTASETKFRMLSETVPNMIWTATPDGKKNFFNQYFLDYTGSTFEELTGEGWQKHIFAADLEKELKLWKQSIETGEDVVLEKRIQKHDGTYRWHLSHSIAQKDEEGNIIEWIGTNTEIEAQKTKEQQKDDFISIASHEMKTPLTTAKGYIELLQLSLTEENQMSLYATKAGEAVERLNELIAELLDASKIQNGQLNYNITSFDFNKMVDETIENIQYSTKNHRIKKTGKCSQLINGDKGRLQQVLINLLSNAIKYSPKADTVLVNIQEQGNNIQVSVQDFGVGMLAKHLNKIFDRYYRVQEHAIHFQGLGIGLYISCNIVQRHEGKMWVESEAGKGSTFYFTLPL